MFGWYDNEWGYSCRLVDLVAKTASAAAPSPRRGGANALPRSVRDADVAGKSVLVRADLNVPLEDGDVADDTRIRASLPTLGLLLDRGAAEIPSARISAGQEGGGPAEVRDGAGRGAAARAAAGQRIHVLENTRFDPGETKNDEGFARELANGRDVYVDDAFGSAHRAHSSTEGVARLLPPTPACCSRTSSSTSGRLLGDVERPFVLVSGGAKVDDKLGVLQHLGGRADAVLVGGKMAEQLRVDNPLDFTVELPPTSSARRRSRPTPSGRLPAATPRRLARPRHRPGDAEGFAASRRGETIFWNGPMGVFEWPRFAEGTKAVAQAVPETRRVLGRRRRRLGRALNELGLADRVSWVSTGGGASSSCSKARSSRASQ